MNDWKADAAEQNLRLSAKLLEQQDEINRLRAEVTALYAVREDWSKGFAEQSCELDALRAEVDDVRAEQEDADTRAAMRNLQDWDAADPDHDGIDWGDTQPHPAAPTKRTEPTTGEDVDWDQVLDAKRRLFARIIANANRLDAPFTNSTLSPWDLLKRDMERLEVVLAARAERTEPTTGEDVEVVAAFVHGRWHGPCDCVPDQTDRNAAVRILAALDLSGREQALREAERERDRLSLAYAALQEEIR